jgi:hypothetical protein
MAVLFYENWPKITGCQVILNNFVDASTLLLRDLQKYCSTRPGGRLGSHFQGCFWPVLPIWQPRPAIECEAIVGNLMPPLRSGDIMHCRTR